MSYPQAILETSHGAITVELWNDVAPNHVENFLKLARSGFYDGLGFHRIVKGFVIQGGCPNRDGSGTPGWFVKAEFNDRPHDEGILSAARSDHPDSAGCQFFICLGREQCRHLDAKYTAFGRVIDGMKTVRFIEAIPVDKRERPKRQPTINAVRIVEPSEE